MGNNIQRLGETLASRMTKTANAAVPTSIELGIINENMSLTTDSLRVPVPKGEYMVDIRLNGPAPNDPYETQEKEEHKHKLPKFFRALKPGDRVLVAWCGNEPVVIAIVVSS